jgi:hypothetical protein
VPITPSGDKVERLRKHRRLIRGKLVQLPQTALWYDEFISEAIQFPYGDFDDQMDALSQYLDWISDHHTPPKRPPMAVVQAVDSQGRTIRSVTSGPSIQTNGIAVQLGSRTMLNRRFR